MTAPLKALNALLLSLAVSLLAACVSPQKADMLQVSWFESFAAGDYAGHQSCAVLKDGCDTGIGTFENIDGELILLDGELYRVAFDGSVTRPAASARTPFANAVKFKPDAIAVLGSGMKPADLGRLFDNVASSPQRFVAAKAKCRFAKIKLRSVPAFQPPYPPLKDVIAKQNVFEHEGISGTLVGIRTPNVCKGMNVPGWHFHFISDDRKVGGHVLDFAVDSGTAELDICKDLLLLLPEQKGLAVKADASIRASSFPGESAPSGR